MNVKEALYSRGKIAGVYPALPTRKDEAYIKFIEDARNILMHTQQRPIGEYSRKLMPRRLMLRSACCNPSARTLRTFRSGGPVSHAADQRPC
jgi:hypothetical protein